MARIQGAKPHRRAGLWYLVRRVPKEFAALDPRVLVRISTDIAIADDPRGIRAAQVVKQLDTNLQWYWRGLADGKTGEARRRFDEAQKRAKSLGFVYQTNAELAEGPAAEILRRVNLLLDKKSLDDEDIVAAVMGGENKPALRLSGLVDEYAALQTATLSAMSPNQQHRWRLPKDKAVVNLIGVVGDKELHALTRSDGLVFRKWWQDRVVIEGLSIGTANKDIGHINKMLRGVDDANQMGLKPSFANLRIEGEETGQRAAFTTEHIQTRIMADGMLDGLNEDARAILLLSPDTGLRPSEAANLLPESIKLNHAVPHLVIEPIDRKLKNTQSARTVPLVGVALEVMKLHPNGFPRYRDKADVLSATINKYLRSRKLLPTDDHSLYSCRHNFEDRLTAVEAPEKLIAALMGHKYSRPKYGAGPSLEQKQKWLELVAFMPPAPF